MKKVFMRVDTEDDQGNRVSEFRKVECDTTGSKEERSRLPIGGSASFMTNALDASGKPLSARNVDDTRRVGDYVDSVMTEAVHMRPSPSSLAKGEGFDEAMSCMETTVRRQFESEPNFERIKTLFAVQYTMACLMRKDFSLEECNAALTSFQQNIRADVLSRAHA